MREIIEFFEKQIKKGKIKDYSAFELQAVEAAIKVLNPWLQRVTMRNIGNILFAGEHGFGVRGLDAGTHCRVRNFTRGITRKTQAFIGEINRSEVETVNWAQRVSRYQQIHWAFTRKEKWLRIEILYEIKYSEDFKGKSIENASLSVKETSLEELIRDNRGYLILRGLFDEIQRVIKDQTKELQELVSFKANLEFANEIIINVVYY